MASGSFRELGDAKMVEGGDYTGSMPMFAIFVLSLYSLYLIPYTVYRLFGSGGDSDGVRILGAHCCLLHG